MCFNTLERELFVQQYVYINYYFSSRLIARDFFQLRKKLCPRINFCDANVIRQMRKDLWLSQATPPSPRPK